MADLQVQLQRALGDAYRIERELGGGGMSRVFVATEVALDRQVVVKVLPPDRRRAERYDGRTVGISIRSKCGVASSS